MKASQGFLFFLILLLAANWPAVSWAAVRPAESFVLCRNNQNVRSIGVFVTEQGCETRYTKAGVPEVVGRGRSQDSCLGFMRNIQGNLEGAHWSCREVSRASVSEISDPQRVEP